MDKKDEFSTLLDDLLKVDVPLLSQKILTNSSKDQIIKKLNALQQSIELQQILEKSDEDVVLWLEELLNVEKQNYNEDVKNQDQHHELTLELGHRLFKNEEVFKIKVTEIVKKDETFTGTCEMEMDQIKFSYVLKYNSEKEINPSLSDEQVVSVLKLMGLDAQVSKERFESITKGFKQKLEDYIAHQLPLCENNDLFGDSEEEDDENDEVDE